MAGQGERVAWVDHARGFAIVLVVFGHAMSPLRSAGDGAAYAVYRWIFAFHMPLFAGLSGYLFQLGLPRYTAQGARFIRGKALLLLVPYLVMSVISYAGIAVCLRIGFLARILQAAGYGPTSLQDAVFQILTYQGHLDQHLWFLPSLFFVFLISYAARRPLLHPLGLLATLALCVTRFAVPEPVLVERTFNLLFYFTLARHLALRRDGIKPVWALPAAAVYAVSVPAILAWARAWGLELNGWVTPDVAITAAVVVPAIAGSVLVTALAALPVPSPAARALDVLSADSMAIYVLHQPFLVSGLGGILVALAWPHPLVAVVVTLAGLAVPISLKRSAIDRSIWLSRLLIGGRWPKPLA